MMGSVWRQRQVPGCQSTRWRFAYVDETGKRRTQTGTHSRRETMDMLRAAEAAVTRTELGSSGKPNEGGGG